MSAGSGENSANGKQAPATPLSIKDELDDLMQDFLHDFQHGLETAKQLGQNVEYHTFDTIVGFEEDLSALIQKTCETVIGEDNSRVDNLHLQSPARQKQYRDCMWAMDLVRAQQRQTLKEILNG